MVQTVSLEFCSIQYHCIRVKFCTHDLYQFPDIRLNSDGSISNFRISGQSLIKENCHNSRTSYYIDMKLAAVARLDKKNKTKSKKVWRRRYFGKLWRHCHFWIFGQIGLARSSHSGHIVCKIYVFSNSNLSSLKN